MFNATISTKCHILHHVLYYFNDWIIYFSEKINYLIVIKLIIINSKNILLNINIEY